MGSTPGRAARRGGSGRLTIGMLTSSLTDLYQTQWLGAVDAAQALGVDLVTFVGHELADPRGFAAESNAIYDLVSNDRLDGAIVWTTTLQLFVGQEGIEEFCRRLAPLPIVSVEQVLAGSPSILIDNRQGMHDAITHLIEVHGHRRIAFLRGPENHPGAQDRYRGYLDALADHGLEANPRLVSDPIHAWDAAEAGAWAAVLAQNERGGLDAIATANDDLALGVLSALEGCGLRPPDDVAVVGFDDSVNIVHHALGFQTTSEDAAEDALLDRAINISATTLPLTTVRPPFYELAWRAVDVLATQLRGGAVPSVVTIPTELIVRRSCGCFPVADEQAAPGKYEAGVEVTSSGQADDRKRGAARAGSTVDRGRDATELRLILSKSSAVLPTDFAERLAESFLDAVNGQSPERFLGVLDEFARMSVRAGESVESWWRALHVLRRQTLPDLPTDAARSFADDLWLRVQLLLSGTAERLYGYRHVLNEKRDHIVREVAHRLITAPDLDELATALTHNLPRVGIPGCYLATYSDGPDGHERTWAKSFLVFEDARRVELSETETLFRSRELVPGDHLASDRCRNLVAMPLYFMDEQQGFVLFEVGPRVGWIYEALQEQLSSALESVLLVKRERDALAAAEEARRRLEDALEERADLLSETRHQNELLQQEIERRALVETALQRTRDELEERVIERTSELAEANATLTRQMLEREQAEEMRANLENQLRHAQKMEALGRLAGGIAHDFNNLLVVINGYSDLLLESLTSKDPARDEVAQIRQAGDRAAALIRQLLAFGRKQIREPSVLDLNDVVTNVEAMLRRLIGEDVELVTSLAPELAPIRADPGQVEQVIVNLAVNARDAMPEGGILTIETANVELDAEYAEQNVGVTPGPHVLLSVGDTGTGMDPSTQARVFEPFFTTKAQGAGTGLGLATVFGIVEQSGGHIAVSTSPDQGATFRLYFPPVAPTVPLAAEGAPAPEPAVTGSETILLVEDDADVRTATRRFLEEYGYKVLEASRAAEALRIVQRDSGPIDLVVTDVVMPGTSGRELGERIGRVRPDIPVLYVSGYNDDATARRPALGGQVALLAKPFSARTLAGKIRDLLDVRAGAPAKD